MADIKTYYLPETQKGEALIERENALNASEFGATVTQESHKPGIFDKIHQVDQIDRAEKYLIRHKFGERIREAEDIDLKNMPS